MTTDAEKWEADREREKAAYLDAEYPDHDEYRDGPIPCQFCDYPAGRDALSYYPPRGFGNSDCATLLCKVCSTSAATDAYLRYPQTGQVNPADVLKAVQFNTNVILDRLKEIQQGGS